MVLRGGSIGFQLGKLLVVIQVNTRVMQAANQLNHNRFTPKKTARQSLTKTELYTSQSRIGLTKTCQKADDGRNIKQSTERK
jgi:hypothetical protein